VDIDASRTTTQSIAGYVPPAALAAIHARGARRWSRFSSHAARRRQAPLHAPEVYPEHDIFIQLMKLKNTLRWMRGEDLITHLGLEYYD